MKVNKVLSFDDPIKPPFPKEQATKHKNKFRDSALFSSKYTCYWARPHFKEMLAERNYTITDALNILQTGVIRNEPEFENNEWRYRVEGGQVLSRSGKATLVIVFRSKTVIHFQTIYKGKNR